jgi:hypothetical protein
MGRSSKKPLGLFRRELVEDLGAKSWAWWFVGVSGEGAGDWPGRSMLALLGGGGGCEVNAADESCWTLGRFRGFAALTRSVGKSYGEVYPPLALSAKLWALLTSGRCGGCCP